jgi:hypothetical protein
MNGVKAEEMPGIKPDPDAPTPHADEDVFEDTGELQFPKQAQKTWLIRVPKDLWTGIERLKDDDTISLGNMHVWAMPDGSQKVRSSTPDDPELTGQIRWHLDKATPGFSMIAKEYDLQVMGGIPKNTFIFSEKDQPGFRAGATNIFGRRFPRPDALRKTESGKIEKPRQRGPRIVPSTRLLTFSPKLIGQNTPSTWPRRTTRCIARRARTTSGRRSRRARRWPSAPSDLTRC